ncbi:MAG: hypothetical protein HQL88_03125 [Magnetococcales bacterium]|nr:hypothetical protein [Magnetococcales bacterium]
MIAKTLLLTSDLFDAAERMQKQLGPELFVHGLLPRLQRLHEALACGPNPDFGTPLMDTLEWGFHSPIQPIVEVIIHAQGFDWRIIGGRRRPFRSLAPGQPIPPAVERLWAQALAKATRFLDGCLQA